MEFGEKIGVKWPRVMEVINQYQLKAHPKTKKPFSEIEFKLFISYPLDSLDMLQLKCFMCIAVASALRLLDLTYLKYDIFTYDSEGIVTIFIIYICIGIWFHVNETCKNISGHELEGHSWLIPLDSYMYSPTYTYLKVVFPVFAQILFQKYEFEFGSTGRIWRKNWKHRQLYSQSSRGKNISKNRA